MCTPKLRAASVSTARMLAHCALDHGCVNFFSALEAGVCALRSCAQKMLQPTRTVAHCPISVAKTFFAQEAGTCVLGGQVQTMWSPILDVSTTCMNPACLLGSTILFRGSLRTPTLGRWWATRIQAHTCLICWCHQSLMWGAHICRFRLS